MPNHLQDGYQTLVDIALIPNFPFWEKRVKPPGLDFGGGIPEETMHSVRYRAKTPKSLVSMTDMTMTGAYHPDVYTDVILFGGLITVITIVFPNGSGLTFYGAIDKFEPAELVEGDQPNATLTILPTLQDTVYNEQAPILNA